jgi:MoaA/NifB/PqqE/SkfB family radical SAM enzyme
MQFVRQNGIASVVVSGGEPTLSKWLIPVVRTLKANGLEFSVSTNATLLTEERTTELASAGLTKATVSLDGATAATHDQLRGPGAFGKALQGLRRLVKAGIDVTVGMFVRDVVVAELRELGSLCCYEGVAKLSFLWPILQGRCRNGGGVLDMSFERELMVRSDELAASGLEVSLLRPECWSEECPSGRFIFGAIGGEAFPMCVYKGYMRMGASPVPGIVPASVGLPASLR